MDTPAPPSAARLALGFALAPAAVPLLVAAVTLADAARLEGPPGYVRGELLEALRFAALRATPLAYALAVAVGLPLVLALRRAGRLSARAVVTLSAVGAAVTVVAAWFLLALPPVGDDDVSPWGPLAALAVAGAFGAALVSSLFCLVARVRFR